MNRSPERTLFVLLAIYAAASLVHFAHNAEFLADYPNLPAAWSRLNVYVAWVAMTAVGAAGWILLTHGWRVAGLIFIAVYAILGLDSLGHYVVAPIASHSAAMNLTIIADVTAAAFVLGEVIRQTLKTARLTETRG